MPQMSWRHQFVWNSVTFPAIPNLGVYSQTSVTSEHFCWPKRKPGKRGKEERENGEEKKENLKGKRWKIGNGRGKKYMKLKISRGLFETAEICLGSTKMDNFYQEKILFHAGKKIEITWLCLLWKIILLCHCIKGNISHKRSSWNLYETLYCSEPSIVPCSIIISPPNFQKKSEILKISDNSPTPKFWVTACQFQISVR